MMRYAMLLGIQLRASLLLAMQYRADFLIESAVEVIWVAISLVPLLVVYGARPSIAGWTYHEALLVTGWFAMLQGVLEAAISPAMSALVEHIRKGTLDFLLLKPVDAQFLASTSRFQPWKLLNVPLGFAIVAYGLIRSGHRPGPWELAQATIMLLVSVSLLLALWTCAACAAFVLVKVDNLTYLFSSVFDAARWPSSVFQGLVRLLFTAVIPLAVMTTFPAEALLGRLEPWRLAAALAGTAAALSLVRRLWLWSLSRYTSASS